jgi:hypothetical protein
MHCRRQLKFSLYFLYTFSFLGMACMRRKRLSGQIACDRRKRSNRLSSAGLAASLPAPPPPGQKRTPL